jgi:hypothetical protein
MQQFEEILDNSLTDNSSQLQADRTNRAPFQRAALQHPDPCRKLRSVFQ